MDATRPPIQLVLNLTGEGRGEAARAITSLAHVDAPRRIGQHFQHVIFGTGIIVPCPENFFFLANPLPFGFRLAGVIAFRVHALVAGRLSKAA
jgi:hypothetical protein